MLKVFALPSLICAVCACVWAGTGSPVLSATTTSGQDVTPAVALDQIVANLPQDDLEDLFVFVAGNVLFTLYHEGGHMLISELGLPVLAQEEDAVDNLATVFMLAADNEDMDLYLAQAMIGWFLIAEEVFEDLVFYDEHDLDQQRGFAMLCLMVGADPSAFRGLARDLELPADRIESCGYDYEQAADSWDIVTSPHVREADGPGGKIRVVHEPAPAGLGSMAVFLKESELMELVAEELDTFYDLPEEVTFRTTTCNEENAYWDPDSREVILCHELLGGFAEIFLSLPGEDQDDG